MRSEPAAHEVLRVADVVGDIAMFADSPLTLFALLQTSKRIRVSCLAVRGRILSPTRLLSRFFDTVGPIDRMRSDGRLVLTGPAVMFFLARLSVSSGGVLTILVGPADLGHLSQLIVGSGYRVLRRTRCEPVESALYGQNNCAYVEEIYFDHAVTGRIIRVCVPLRGFAHGILYQRSSMLLNAFTASGLISLYPAALLLRGQSLVLQYHSYATRAYRSSYKDDGFTLHIVGDTDGVHPSLAAGPRLFGDRWCLLIPTAGQTVADVAAVFQGNAWSIAKRSYILGPTRYTIWVISAHVLASPELVRTYVTTAVGRAFVLRVMHAMHDDLAVAGAHTLDEIVPAILRALYDGLPFVWTRRDGTVGSVNAMALHRHWARTP